MNSIIGKAIEGKYEPSILNEYWKMGNIDIALAELVIDVHFWQALGRACGWTIYDRSNWKKDDVAQLLQDQHIAHAMEFYKINLTEGWNKAVDYLLGVTGIATVHRS